MRWKLYLKNAALLTVGSMALRVLGMGFRVYIAVWLGGEGMGLYQLILAVYSVFVALASAGVNVAATRLAAQSLARRRGMGPTLWGLVSAAACFGTAAMLAQAALAGPVARFMLHDARAELGLWVLAPSLPFLAVSGALRGCFLARRRVGPNVTAQLIEQLVRLVVAALALRVLAQWGAGYACAAVLVGNTVSEGVSCLLMAAFAGREPSFRRQSGDPARGFTGRELLLIALPVEGSRLAVSALQAVESSLIPLCLAMYLGDRSAAVAQYGALKGMALPLIFFPFALLGALSGLLMPEITRLHTCRDSAGTARLIHVTLAVAGLFSMLAGAALVLFGQELAWLLYRDAEVGRYVRLLGFLAPVLYLESMVDGILKGLGQQFATFRYSVLDCAVRILSACLLVPRYGALGFIGMMALSNLLSFGLNMVRLLRCTGMRPAWGGWLARPAVAAGMGSLLALGAGATGAAFGIAEGSWAHLGWQVSGYLLGAAPPVLWLLLRTPELRRAQPK